MKSRYDIIGLIFIPIIIAFCTLGPLLFVVLSTNIKAKKPNEVYVKAKEIVDNQSLIGLTKEEVIEVLGEPEYENNNKEGKIECRFNAGKIYYESFMGKIISRENYLMVVCFEKNNKVEYARLRRRELN